MKTVRMDYKHGHLSKAVCIDGDTVNFAFDEHPKKFFVFSDHTKKHVVNKSATLEFPNTDIKQMFLHQLEDHNTIKDALKTLKDMGDYFHHVEANKMLIHFLNGYSDNSKNSTYSCEPQAAHDHRM